jgi:hypothetical protein
MHVSEHVHPRLDPPNGFGQLRTTLRAASGHLDSWDLGPGAIEDGAGVAVSMQAVHHLLSKLGIRPRRTVCMIAWMSDEPGVLGAMLRLRSRDRLGGVGERVG